MFQILATFESVYLSVFYGACKEQTQKTKFRTKFSSNSHVHGSLLVADGLLHGSLKVVFSVVRFPSSSSESYFRG